MQIIIKRNNPFSSWQIWLLGGIIALIALTLGILVTRNIIVNRDLKDITWKGYPHEKWIALTFDDGPDPRFTPKILAILRKYHVPATFFVVGKNAKLYPDIIKSEIVAGHEVGNHTYNHPHMSRLSYRQMKTQISSTNLQIKKITGTFPELFRPPYEELNGNILKVSRINHFEMVMSTITLERSSIKSPKENAARVIRQAFPGAIILAHDGRLDRTKTVKALPYLIRGLQQRGYRFVPVRIFIR